MQITNIQHSSGWIDAVLEKHQTTGEAEFFRKPWSLKMKNPPRNKEHYTIDDNYDDVNDDDGDNDNDDDVYFLRIMYEVRGRRVGR